MIYFSKVFFFFGVSVSQSLYGNKFRCFIKKLFYWWGVAVNFLKITFVLRVCVCEIVCVIVIVRVLPRSMDVGVRGQFWGVIFLLQCGS